MSIDPLALVAILAMAAVTYATRAAGYWLSGRLVLSARVLAYLRAIPGAVLTSLVAPSIAEGGLTFVVAAATTLVVAARTRNLLVAAITGAVTVSLARAVGG
jgi:uncharacterized membrane protein